jgi:hypothetical protein
MEVNKDNNESHYQHIESESHFKQPLRQFTH